MLIARAGMLTCEQLPDAYTLLVDDKMSRTTPRSITSLSHRPGNLLRISLVENTHESYSPQGIDVGIDLEGFALFKGNGCIIVK
jgi:hypothetical protein